MKFSRKTLASCVLLAGLAGALWAQNAAAKSSIVPDTFLRGYDPVTVFYDTAVGPARGGPADGPGNFLSISPAVAGEYRWLDARTIQFLPAVPWPALREFTISARDRNVKLTTMMVPPSTVAPAPGSTGLDPIGSFTLAFPAVLDTDTLARMIRFEVRELPGLSTEGSWWLTSSDFTVRELERSKTGASSSYLVTLKSPIPYGKHVILYLKLSLDESIRDSAARYSFQTRPEFRLIGMGSGSVRFPVTPTGASYPMDQAVNCGTESAPLFLEFSEDIRPVSIEVVKRMVSFDPAVRNLRTEAAGTTLDLYFDCDRDKPYKLTVNYQNIASMSGRPLNGFAAVSFYFYFRQASPYLVWKAAQGIAERFGPQFIPMEGRGLGRVDIRVYAIDPRSLNYWPFPPSPIAIDENSRPPMPGEEPGYGNDIPLQIRLLGSPDVSKIIDLPISEQSGRTGFGLDLSAALASRFGANAPGTYLVGYRILDGTNNRSYVRLSLTDLCLSTVEEESAVVFTVTSLKTGAPVIGANIGVEYRTDTGMKPLFSGTTDQTGRFRWEHTRAYADRPARIVVSKDNDILVLDPRVPPPTFADNHWSQVDSSWLSWITSTPNARKHETHTLGYIITERPVYRPEESVYILGWVRDWQDGKIRKYGGSDGFQVAVFGPGDKEWEYPADLSGNGRFSIEFKEKDLPTGQYTAVVRAVKSQGQLASVSFQKESYRVPLFEVNISGPDKAPLDRPFDLVLTADYYAGGRVVGEDVAWDVTRYPYSIAGAAYQGFLFSTDQRFFGAEPSAVSGVLAKSDVLDANGSSKIQINPAAERDGRARRYVARATVRGADRQTVTTVKQVYALPPFSIGLKLDRFLTDSTEIKPQIIVLDHQEMPLSGTSLTIRLSQRQWHSYIAETDFTTGEVKYVTDVVDKPMSEQTAVSTTAVMSPSFTVKEAGIYIVEVFARDFLGRQISVKSDLFVAGGTPVSWEKKTESLFEVTPDKKSYQPGDTATLLLKSPYQEGYAMVVVERPEDNLYDWVRVTNGQGIYKLPIRETMAPGVPVGILLERGRVPGTENTASKLDLGKPAALGASIRLDVKPVANQIGLTLDHDAKSTPGADLHIRINMTDWKGNPLNGEAALWLVDKAVLALGAELPLTPLSPFIQLLPSFIRISDTRNLAFGNLPPAEIPGGDGSAEAALARELFDKVTVRKNLKTVPYFNPAIQVKNGTAEVVVSLPDNLTDFAVRAIATSGFDKFGSARSQVSVRLPVLVQSALPRFVRPGDAFSAGGIARVVEGSGGPGAVGMTVEGLEIQGRDPAKAVLPVTLDDKAATRLIFPLSVPDSLSEKGGATVAVSLYVQRNSDQAKDAFRIELPVRNDTGVKKIVKTEIADGTKVLPLPDPAEQFRLASVTRTIIAARDPRLLALIKGLNYLAGYEHGCLEQRISKIYPAVMLKDLLTSSGIPKYYPLDDVAVKSVFDYMASCQNDEGLFGFWPGSLGYVSMTAYAVEFMVSCKSAGITFDPALLSRATSALMRALRSDYQGLLSGWTSYERVEALAALDAAGVFDEGYAGELLGASPSLGLYSQARLYAVLQHRGLASSRDAKQLAQRLQGSVTTKREGNREIFAGLQANTTTWGGLVLSSQIKTVGSLMDALFRIDPKASRLGMLTDYLVSQSGDGGWGDTQDNVAAMRALKLMLTSTSSADATLEISSGSGKKQVSMGGKALAVFSYNEAASMTVALTKGASKSQPVYLLMSTEYIPSARGSKIKGENAGFAVTRELITIGADGTPAAKLAAGVAKPIELPLDAVVEEHARVVNFEDRSFVAVSVPIACGFEPLNPQLAGSPKEAVPLGTLTLQPAYSLYADDRVVFYYDTLPKGTYDFYFRERASFSGSFSEPPVKAELMYDLSVRGTSDGTEIRIAPAK